MVRPTSSPTLANFPFPIALFVSPTLPLVQVRHRPVTAAESTVVNRPHKAWR